jgi:hypothetical protein
MVRRNPEGAFGEGMADIRTPQPVEPEDDWEEGADEAADRYERDL